MLTRRGVLGKGGREAAEKQQASENGGLLRVGMENANGNKRELQQYAG
jgi:hypothetical protein